MAEEQAKDAAPGEDSILRGLVDDAKLVAGFGQRAGVLGDSGLFGAIQEVEAETQPKWSSKKVATLQKELNSAINAISPVTLVDLRGGWDPFNRKLRGWAVDSLFRYVYVVIAILLIFPAIHYTQWLKRAEAVVVEQELNRSKQIEDIIHEIHDEFLHANGDATASFAEIYNGPSGAVLRRRLREARQLDAESREAQREYNAITDQFFLAWSVVINGRYTDLWKDYGSYSKYIEGQNRVLNSGPPPVTNFYPCDDKLANTLLASDAASNGVSLASADGPKNTSGAVLDQAGHLKLATDFNKRIVDDELRMDVIRCLVGADVPLLGVGYDDADLKQKIETIGLWLLPALFGAFGAVVYHLRACWNRLRPDPRFGRAILRIFLGAFGGIAFGWFFAPTAAAEFLPQTLPLGAYAFAFLIGYSIDIFFALLDRLVHTLSRAIGTIGSEKPKQEAG